MDALPIFRALIDGGTPLRATRHDLRWLHKEHLWRASHGADRVLRAWHQAQAAHIRDTLALRRGGMRRAA